jgi:hypothetical protein
MKAAIVAVAAAAAWIIVSKLNRGNGKRSASKPAVEPEASPNKLPNIIEEEQDHEEHHVQHEIDATPSHKRRASGSVPATSDEKEHKIKAMKVNSDSPPASPLVLKNASPEPVAVAVPEQVDETESIPSPPRTQPPVTAPPAAPIPTLSSEFAAGTSQDSAFPDEAASIADSEASSLSRANSLQRLGSKVKNQLRKISSRKNSNQ